MKGSSRPVAPSLKMSAWERRKAMIGNKIQLTKKLSDTNYVYVLLNDVGMIKIGITDNPYERFNAIQNASGSLITNYYLSEPIKNNYEIEQYLHKYFKKYNTVAEWYKDISFNEVVNYVSDYIDKNGEPIIKAKYVVVARDSSNIIDIDEYIDVFAKLIATAKMLNLQIANDTVFIEKMDNLIFEYENLLYSDIEKIDKVIGLATYANALEKSIFLLLDKCGANNMLSNPIYYNFFNKYYNVEKANKLKSNKNVRFLY